jgi:hypothetical protein
MFRIRDYSAILPLTPDEMNRLLSRRRVDENGCWTWTGYVGPDGYGQIELRGRSWRVHRLFHEIFAGHVPTDLVVHHTCGNRACCNPAHQELTTSADNVRRGKFYYGVEHHNGGRTHCRRGHPLSGDNVIHRRQGNGHMGRICRLCERIRRTNARLRRRVAIESAVVSSTVNVPCATGGLPASAKPLAAKQLLRQAPAVDPMASWFYEI